MKIDQKTKQDRESKIRVLFFDHKMKQKKIAEKLNIKVRTVEDYVAKIKKKDLH